MRITKRTPVFLAAMASLWFATPGLPARADEPSKADQKNSQAQVKVEAQQNIQKQKQEAQEQASKNLDQEAISAIQETQNAIKAISENKNDEAVAALERASGKINILVGRNPATAILPVQVNVDVIDIAPQDVESIKTVVSLTDRAMDAKDYPQARVLLQSLISEIRVRTYNLPLTTYPIAMKDAARLIDEKKPEEAKAVLQVALNTLAVVDKVTPLPVAVADEAIRQAQAQRDKDKKAALQLLAVASSELDRAKELGYAGKDPEYAAMSSSISDLEKQLRGNENTTSAFTRLKEKLTAFFKRQSSSEKRSEVASTK